MTIKKIYRQRFKEFEARNKVWSVLARDFFQQFIRKGDIVVDIGCGYGEFINNILAKEKLAVDLNPEVKKFVTKKVKFFQGNSTRMPFIKDNSVNKIFISNFFEHLSRPDIEKTIKELKRILKKGGQTLVLQPNIRLLPCDYWMFFDHLTPIDDRALEEIFAVYGFILKKRIFKFLPFTTKSRYPKSPLMVYLYLKMPFLWFFFGKQSFLIFEKL